MSGPPYPRWIPYNATHQESLLHQRAKKYPLLVVSNHPRWGSMPITTTSLVPRN